MYIFVGVLSASSLWLVQVKLQVQRSSEFAMVFGAYLSGHAAFVVKYKKLVVDSFSAETITHNFGLWDLKNNKH